MDVHALVATGDERLVDIRRVPGPAPRDGESLIRVRAVSVNRGELHRLTDAASGWRPGWDFAGVLAAASGSHPPGTPVFGMALGGSWATLISVPRGLFASVPGSMAYETAAALPVAGLTALRMLRLCGDLTGRSVLVTGAAGGVGRFAVQLAHAAGAMVTAVVGNPGHAAGLPDLGADDVVTGLKELADRANRSFDVICESAGGASLADSVRLCGHRGRIISFGNSERTPTEFSISDFYPKEAILQGFYLPHDIVRDPPENDLTSLAAKVASGAMKTDIVMTRNWADAADALLALRSRATTGKAVLRLPEDDLESDPDGR